MFGLLSAVAAAGLLSGSLTRAESSLVPRATYTGGDITHYDGGSTSCGTAFPVDSKADMAVAVSFNVFNTYPGATPQNPNLNPICGKQIKATLNGVSINVEVRDKCGACKDADLDLTDKAFEALGVSLGAGRISGLEWEFADGTGGGSPASSSAAAPVPTTTSIPAVPVTTTSTPAVPVTTTSVPAVPVTTSSAAVAPVSSSSESAPAYSAPSAPSPINNGGAASSGSSSASAPASSPSTSASAPSSSAAAPVASSSASAPASSSPASTSAAPQPSTSAAGACVDTWTSCNAKYKGVADDVKSYKCGEEYMQCVAAELKKNQNAAQPIASAAPSSAKRMHRKRNAAKMAAHLA